MVIALCIDFMIIGVESYDGLVALDRDNAWLKYAVIWKNTTCPPPLSLSLVYTSFLEARNQTKADCLGRVFVVYPFWSMDLVAYFADSLMKEVCSQYLNKDNTQSDLDNHPSTVSTVYSNEKMSQFRDCFLKYMCLCRYQIFWMFSEINHFFKNRTTCNPHWPVWVFQLSSMFGPRVSLTTRSGRSAEMLYWKALEVFSVMWL